MSMLSDLEKIFAIAPGIKEIVLDASSWDRLQLELNLMHRALDYGWDGRPPSGIFANKLYIKDKLIRRELTEFN